MILQKKKLQDMKKRSVRPTMPVAQVATPRLDYNSKALAALQWSEENPLVIIKASDKKSQRKELPNVTEIQIRKRTQRTPRSLRESTSRKNAHNQLSHVTKTQTQNPDMKNSAQ